MIRRGFVEGAAGQVHYRTGGSRGVGATDLYVAHSAPGSSLGLVPLLERLECRSFVIAPDMLGCGDSPPPAVVRPDIAYLAASALEIMDALGLEYVDFYGSHTGAEIGCELAAAHPSRVRRLVLDGLAVFPDALRVELLDRYAPPRSPTADGRHLLWAWNFARDMRRYFPHYDQRPETALRNPQPSAAQLQLTVMDILKNLETYHLAYQAAFSYPVAERLRDVKNPVLLMAVASDPLSAYLEATAKALPTAATLLLPASTTAGQRAAAIRDFLD